MIFPMANIATLVGPDGTTANEGIGLTSLIASIFVVFFGILSIVSGYLQAVHDVGNLYLTGFLLFWAQLSWMPFLTDLTDVAKGARSGEAFIPAAYEPSETDVRFVGAMGMMGILGYGSGFLGSLSFIHFSLYAFQAGKPGDRPGYYYAGRLTFYTFANFLVGLAQLMLGIYVLRSVGSGPLPDGPVSVAMFLVNFPEISVTVGLVQVLNALYGMVRSFGFHGGENDSLFQATTLFQAICTIVLQVLVQVSYAPGGTAAAAAPSQTMITLGISVIVAYLDFKMRITPDALPRNYYGLEEVEVESSGTETEKRDIETENRDIESEQEEIITEQAQNH